VGCPAARGRWRRWVGGASGEGVEIPEKAEIESEWAEWQTGIAEQQVYAEIDPRPGEDDDYDSPPGWPRDPSFIGPEVQGGAQPRSDALSPESSAPIGPQPPLDPTVMAGTGLTLYPARHVQAVESSRSKPHDMNRLAPNSRAVLRRLAEGRVGPACPLGHPRCAAVGADQCACFVRTPCGPSDPGRTACLCVVTAVSR